MLGDEVRGLLDITVCRVCLGEKVEVVEKVGRASFEIFDQFVL
jgi:hypothetical protein